MLPSGTLGWSTCACLILLHSWSSKKLQVQRNTCTFIILTSKLKSCCWIEQQFRSTYPSLLVKLRETGLSVGLALLEFRTQHCLRIWPWVPVSTPILPILRKEIPNCSKNASWLLEKCSTSFLVSASLKRDISDVNRHSLFLRFLKYWLSNLSGVTGSLKNWVLLS